jgi:hypothetical protein
MASGFHLDPTRLRREVPIHFPGPAGSIQGLWRDAPPDSEARGVVVVAHPHPAHGGTMLNKVVFHTARVLNHDLKLATLRFNFRGVGESEGTYDEGRGETGDLRAAWSEAARRMPGIPLVGSGFSFGAAMTLTLAANSPREGGPSHLALLGIPSRLFPLPEPFPHPIPIAAAHGARDQFTPPERIEEYLESWPGKHAWHVEPDTDHFFEGKLPSVTRFLSHTLGGWLDGAGTASIGEP